MITISENRCFGGTQGVYSHTSTACACDMMFAVFMPEEAQHGPVPVLWFLSGLTCTHENAMVKAGAQAWAAEQGIALVFPDTSPRGDDVPNDDAFDLGQGAGFYIDATEAPWDKHFKMWTYVTDELPALLAENFAIDMDRQSITCQRLRQFAIQPSLTGAASSLRPIGDQRKTGARMMPPC